jgi:enoyl-CoA hydratase/carnithine racemase
MAEGKYVIGLNEIPVGIIVPDLIFNLYAFCIGRRRGYQYLLEGKLLQVNEALHIGLIDEVCDAADVLAAAEKKIRTYMALNPVTWSQSKMNFRRELTGPLQTDQTEMLNKMLKQWWSPETRNILQGIIQNLKKPSSKKA